MPDGDRQTVARVREVYDEIADHFAETRRHAWPEVEEFLATAEGGAFGLDVGCGNGRHTELLARHVDHALGLDASRRLLAHARDRAADGDARASFLQGSAGRLPIADGSIDLSLYVATIHHLPSRDRRRGSLDELARVLRDGAPALVSAWSTAHDRFDASGDADTGFDTTIDWTLPGGETVGRFYHIYAPAEFERDLRASALTLEGVEVSSGNCYARVHG